MLFLPTNCSAARVTVFAHGSFPPATSDDDGRPDSPSSLETGQNVGNTAGHIASE